MPWFDVGCFAVTGGKNIGRLTFFFYGKIMTPKAVKTKHLTKFGFKIITEFLVVQLM